MPPQLSPIHSSECCDPSSDSDDGRGHGCEGRGHVEEADSDRGSSEAASKSAGSECQEHSAVEDSEEAADPVQLISAASLATRASQMFVVCAKWPTEMRHPLMARFLTNEAVQLAVKVCILLCDRDGKICLSRLATSITNSRLAT